MVRRKPRGLDLASLTNTASVHYLLMARRIAIIQGHSDPAGHHLLHVLADAYAEGAIRAGHELRRVEVAKLEFPLLRTQQEFESGPVPPL
jgi:hypothetical protein